jgi:hypothetical protein
VQLESLQNLTRILQASISPVALISGVGLLLLSQTNRFSRITDRLRELMRERWAQNGSVDPVVSAQIRIFHRRARIMRYAISASVLSVLIATGMVLSLFVIAVLGLRFHWAVLTLFAGSLGCLILSLMLFLWDMHLSLSAVEEELNAEVRSRPSIDR